MMLDININRIQRLLNLNGLANVHVGFDDYFLCSILSFQNQGIHIFPGYNQNSINDQKAFIDKLLISDFTAAMPVLNYPFDSSDYFRVFDRPNLYTVDLSNDLDLIWSNIKRRRQISIESYDRLLRFEVADSNSPLIHVFVDLYLNLQIKRLVPLVNFFDSDSLYNIINTSQFKLCYAINIAARDSILFHLVRVNGDELEYFFSANTDLESRNYSAYLHWNIIKWSRSEHKNCFSYDLGGGIVKDDGVERFKREMGGVAHPRWYFLYPKLECVEGEFFPVYASFLNMKNFRFN
jgi:hypothetical protein